MRAVSTVLDVVVFLLLVGGAVTLLVGTHSPPPRATTAHDTADVLGTSTATVTYTPNVTGLSPTNASATNGIERTARGTLAELLAAAAVADATLDDTELTAASNPFERAVADAVASNVSRATVGTHVTAVWQPYPESPLRGSVTVGPSPPADAEVHAATLLVPSGLPRVTGDVPDSDGIDGVATAIAERVVGGLFPPRSTRMALAADGTVATETRSRYRNVAAALGIGLNDSLASNDATAANDDLEAALETKLRRDLTSRYDSVEATLSDTQVGAVRITVRTWSA